LYHVTVRTTDRSMAPRTYPAIGVTQIPNGQGTCQFITLHNGALTTSNHFKSIPMTTDVIRQLNTLAAADRHRVTIDAPFHINGVPISGPLSSEGGLRDIITTHGILPADQTEVQAEPTCNIQPQLGETSDSIIQADLLGTSTQDIGSGVSSQFSVSSTSDSKLFCSIIFIRGILLRIAAGFGGPFLLLDNLVIVGGPFVPVHYKR
jgi:hypothetical protein